MAKKDKSIEVQEKQAVEQAAGEPTWAGSYFTPAVDIYSSDTEITVVADMPGVGREGLDIDLREGVLTLLGKVEDEPTDQRIIQREYGIGGYLRKFNISDDVDVDGIEASLAEGVLTLVLPKTQAARPRKIEVRTD